MSVKLFAVIAVCLLCSFSAIGQSVLEGEARLVMGEKTQAVILFVDAAAAQASVPVSISIVAPSGEVKAAAEKAVPLIQGRNSVEIPIDIGNFAGDKDFPYSRLGYTVDGIAGTVSLSRIASDIFELEAFAFDFMRANGTYRVRVRALQPTSLKAVPGVKLAGELAVDLADGAKKNFDLSRVTDGEGFADLEFRFQPGADVEDVSLKITGTKFGLTRKIERDLPEYSFKRSSFLYFQTDKPIYQPGQALRVRALLFGDDKKAIAGDALTFAIKDEDGTVLQKLDTTTSRFGIAAVEWQIPENAKLGEYSIVVSSGRELNRDQKKIKIGRYDLPNFTVSAAPDRKYYLPKQKTASVTVRADYLFGKPVSRAKVRVVEEKSREWDYRLQKYITDEGQVKEGEFDADGKFTAEIDLAKAHEDFDTYDKFEDIHYAAYVTDLTTNRTEQRRFDIRITRNEIHVYLAGKEYNMSRGLPARLYVTTFYADGTPASCDFRIYKEHEDSDSESPKAGKLILGGKTNRIGAARVLLPLGILGEDDNDLDIVIKAKDADGRRGVARDSLDFDDEKPAVAITTDKVLYRPGEPVEVTALSSAKDDVLLVDVLSGSQVIFNERVKLADGKAAFQIPYQNNFKGSLNIIAYGSYRDDEGDARTYGDTRPVAYPTPWGMAIRTETEKPVFRPGEQALVKLSSMRADGSTPETAFGVAILDKAVEQRARTDADFGGGYQSFYGDFEDVLGLRPGFAGLTGAAVDNLDMSQPIPPELELAVEISLVNRMVPDIEDSGNFINEIGRSYKTVIQKQLKPVGDTLRGEFLKNGTTAIDDNSLRRILASAGADLDSLRDPWGNSYWPVVSVQRERSEVTIWSSGADELPNTGDDISAYTGEFRYFYPTGRRIDEAFSDFAARTGGYIFDLKTLRAELRAKGTELDELRDPWNKPYKFAFAVAGDHHVFTVKSGGWDRHFGGYGDFDVWSHSTDYFALTRSKMAEAFRENVRRTQKFPRTEAEFRNAMNESGFDLSAMKDIFGRRYYIVEETRANFADRRKVDSGKLTLIPITQDVVAWSIRSTGSDGVKGNADDFELARFTGVVAEKNKDGSVDRSVKTVPSSRSNRGGVTGIVTDPNGAVIPNAAVTAESYNTKSIKTTRTDDEGRFVFADLHPGYYEINVESPGFVRLRVQNVYVQPLFLTEIDVLLEVGSVSSTVEVVAAEGDLQTTTNASVSQTISSGVLGLPLNSRNAMELLSLSPGAARSGLRNATDKEVNVVTKSGTTGNRGATAQQIETPRLREYFPESLLWLPELLSSTDGTAKFNFKLADNLTTWKIGVIGSTEDGDIGVAEKEIRTFQPFFVDLDPPKFLTEGDEISLPVQVRNYTDKKQNVDLTMAKADWFSMLNSEKQLAEVPSGETRNAVFGFRAVSPIRDGKQRVTAVADSDSDAIEKRLTVRPNGREIVKTDSRFFTGSAQFDVGFPADALPGTGRTELKIYPNLLSHVTDSVEGLLKRPYGCGEQTISSTYPNLMILKFVKSDSPLRRNAQRYLQKGYDRLLGYQSPDGGFTYWGAKDKPDIALTAYALRFLNDAKSYIEVDPDVIKKAQDWLIRQQRADGSWAKKYDWEKTEDTRQTKLITTYVARSLAMVEGSDKAALKRALDYMRSRNAEIDDPYSLAMFGLASLDAGDSEAARETAGRLDKLAIAESDAVYWNLESNTPFYGWGRTGRIETTALVVQLLTRTGDKSLSGKGMLFLLKNKDRFGVWYSTQTTINVLDAFLTTLGSSERAAQPIQVLANGREILEVSVDAGKIEPIIIDITQNPGTVEVRAAAGDPVMSQVTQSYYVDWRNSTAAGVDVNQSRAVKLDYTCDKTAAAIMDEITCSVAAERIGFRGYGMLLAEIGTPPGADVSRESLEEAMKEDWSLSRYEVLPDRIVLYMWAKPGGTRLNFKFRPRYGINAQSPASVAYDYYNPEAQATVAPLRFEVK